MKLQYIILQVASSALILEDLLLAKYSLTMGLLALALQANLLLANRIKNIIYRNIQNQCKHCKTHKKQRLDCLVLLNLGSLVSNLPLAWGDCNVLQWI